MSGVTGDFAVVSAAFRQPALSLLHSKFAPAIVTILRACFGRDLRPIPSGRLHAEIDSALTELSISGTHERLPAGSARELSMRWVREQWLVRSVDADGAETYALTSHAQQALKFVQDLRRERPQLSEHRITNIIATARRINSDTNPDRGARIGILDEDIARLTAERDRLVGGGALDSVAPEYLMEGFIELLSLVSQLPSDFSRVEEVFAELRAQILQDFRSEERTPGEVIDYYLRRTDTLVDATPEGRAFEGAFVLLRDEALLLQLREDLAALIEHPMSEIFLVDQDRQELRGIVALIRAGLSSVLAQRNRVSATLRDYILTRDVAGDRELDRVLRELDGAVTEWMQFAAVRDTVPIRFLPEVAAVDHLRERFHDPAGDVSPPSLVTHDDDDRPDTPSLAELRTQGGPFFEELRAALDTAQMDPDWTMVRSFDGLPDRLQRPVDALGLLHLATNRGSLGRDETPETYITKRPDGSTRALLLPRVKQADQQEDDGK